MSKNLEKWTAFCWTTGSFSYSFFVETKYTARAAPQILYAHSTCTLCRCLRYIKISHVLLLGLLWHVLILFVPFSVPWNHMILTFCDYRSWIHLDVVHKNENLKKGRHKGWFVWPIDPVAHLRQSKGCQVRTFELTRLRTSEKGKKEHPSGCRGKLWKKHGVGGWSSTRPNVKVNHHGVDVDSVLVLLGLTHICARCSLNEPLPQFNWRIPNPACKLSQGRHSNPPHLHIQTQAKCIRVLRQQFALSEDF